MKARKGLVPLAVAVAFLVLVFLLRERLHFGVQDGGSDDQPESGAVPSPGGSRDELLLEELASQYSGKIATSAPNGVGEVESIGESVRLMEELLEQWNPIGYTTNDLERILGGPSEETAGELRYRFDSGLGGWEWIFAENDGIIRSVTRRSLD